jgi:hypothetical protein
VLSVDPIESAMWRAGLDRAQPTGLAAYLVAESIALDSLAPAEDNLRRALAYVTGCS